MGVETEIATLVSTPLNNEVLLFHDKHPDGFNVRVRKDLDGFRGSFDGMDQDQGLEISVISLEFHEWVGYVDVSIELKE